MNYVNGQHIEPIQISTFGDASALNGQQYVYNGAAGTWVPVRAIITFKDMSAVNIATIATVWTPASGKRIRLLRIVLSVTVAASVLFEDNAAGAANFLFRTPALIVGTPYMFDFGDNGRLLAAANNVLKATASVASVITGTLMGVEE